MTDAKTTVEPQVKHVVAVAILYQEGQFLMQLRDDNPEILYPGHWGFFGGHLDPGETPEQGLMRELEEEIGYQPSRVELFCQNQEPHVERNVFHAPLTVPLATLVLSEGLDLSLVSPEAVRLGRALSPRLREERPLGAVHRQLLLDFMGQIWKQG